MGAGSGGWLGWEWGHEGFACGRSSTCLSRLLVSMLHTMCQCTQAQEHTRQHTPVLAGWRLWLQLLAAQGVATLVSQGPLLSYLGTCRGRGGGHMAGSNMRGECMGGRHVWAGACGQAATGCCCNTPCNTQPVTHSPAAAPHQTWVPPACAAHPHQQHHAPTAWCDDSSSRQATSARCC
jgi:hypothetical protein